MPMRDNHVVSTVTPQTDATAVAAVDEARTALVDQVGAAVVGDHLDAHVEDDGVVTHYFACTQAGYPGWRWAVTVAQPSGQPDVTIDEVALLPTELAITAPAWVPWRERIQPGDLSPGDLLPADEDDLRLVPGYFAGDVDGTPLERGAVRALDDEIGLGRPRVLSVEGRSMAADRWYAGEPGPDVPLAQSAPGMCGGCGFLVRLAGPLSLTFGVCANEFANDDGRVVALEHGCGAHSEAQLRKKQLPPPMPEHVFDSLSGDMEKF